MRMHLKRKTAWSNSSLIGSRVSCLLDFKEWQEGYVLQYHRSGKHQIDFVQLGQRRWLPLKKIAFYVIEQPISSNLNSSSEFKDDDIHINHENDNLSGNENDWDYFEEISLEYSFTQSVLFKIYGSTIQETGHKTKGHISLTEDDRNVSSQNKGSLLYGELLPRGSNKAFGRSRLNVAAANILFDLGMGTGKICCQAFLQYKNLDYVYGVELSQGRYLVAEEAMICMVDMLGHEYYHINVEHGKQVIVRELPRVGSDGVVMKERILHLQCGSLFDVKNVEIADIVMLETDIPADMIPDLCHLLDKMHTGARVLSYLDLRRIWSITNPLSYKQLDINRYISDRYPTSWSVQRGHHFFLWIKIDVSNFAFGLLQESSDNDYVSSTLDDLTSSSRRRKNTELEHSPSNYRCFPSFGFLSVFRSRFSTSNRNSRDKDERVIPLNLNFQALDASTLISAGNTNSYKGPHLRDDDTDEGVEKMRTVQAKAARRLMNCTEESNQTLVEVVNGEISNKRNPALSRKFDNASEVIAEASRQGFDHGVLPDYSSAGHDLDWAHNNVNHHVVNASRQIYQHQGKSSRASCTLM